MNKGIAEFNKGVHSQTKENKEAAEMMSSGVKALQAEANNLSGEMQEKSRDLHKRSREMLEDGIRKFEAGQADFRKDLEAQKRSNEDSVAKFNSDVKNLQSSSDKMSRELQNAGKQIREEGFRNLQNGMADFKKNVNMQVKENKKAISRIDSSAKELQEKARTFQGEIHRYQELDLKNYVKDFYYG